MTIHTTAAPSGKNAKGQTIVRCFSQADFDAAIKRKNVEVWICGRGTFSVAGDVRVLSTDSSRVVALGSSHVVAWGSSHVEAWESSHVEARESSRVVALGSSRVVAMGSSHVEAMESSRVEALGSSHVVAWESSHVEAWESSHVEARESSRVVALGSSHVEARGSSHVEARESSRVVASKLVAVHRHSKLSTVTGGVVIEIELPRTASDWCDWYGVKVIDGIATVYKGVRNDYRSAHGLSYAPGTVPAAPDWDGGARECGGGLHFSPSAAATKQFDSEARRFLACHVRLSDMRAPTTGDDYPTKIKASGCCGPCVEVDLFGRTIAEKVA